MKIRSTIACIALAVGCGGDSTLATPDGAPGLADASSDAMLSYDAQPTPELDAGPDFTLSGSLIGLEGESVSVALVGGETLVLTSDGPFSFSPLLPDGTPFEVEVVAQPLNPDQVCTIEDGTGQINAGNANVSVQCNSGVNLKVAGYSLPGALTVTNTDGQSTTLSDGSYTFPNKLFDGELYDVRVEGAVGVDASSCRIYGGLGVASDEDIQVVVDCGISESYRIIGSVGTDIYLWRMYADGVVASPQLISNQITADSFVYPPVISENGRYLVVASLFLISVDLDAAVPAPTVHSTFSAGHHLSDDGRYLVFEDKESVFGAERVYRFDFENDSAPALLHDVPGSFVIGSEVDPSGKHVLYAVRYAADQSCDLLYREEVGGVFQAPHVVIPQLPLGHCVREYLVSPTVDRVTYTRLSFPALVHGDMYIGRITASGTIDSKVKIEPGPNYDTATPLAFSPNGDWLLARSGQGNLPRTIFAINLRSGNSYPSYDLGDLAVEDMRWVAGGDLGIFKGRAFESGDTLYRVDFTTQPPSISSHTPLANYRLDTLLDHSGRVLTQDDSILLVGGRVSASNELGLFAVDLSGSTLTSTRIDIGGPAGIERYWSPDDDAVYTWGVSATDERGLFRAAFDGTTWEPMELVSPDEQVPYFSFPQLQGTPDGNWHFYRVSDTIRRVDNSGNTIGLRLHDQIGRLVVKQMP